MIKIPKCMSTQHPDNVNIPFFAENSMLKGDDEIQEAYYAFSHLDCDEQMWDCEGKEVDNFVIKKLLTKYESFFKEKRLGKDLFLTLRVPNPTIERTEAKILLETLESIPRSFDTANRIYDDNLPPVFEVILPMTGSHECINRIYKYYKDFVVGKQHKKFKKDDITIAEWIGKFEPETINVIPLFEDLPHMLDAHNIIEKYLKDKTNEYQRVFLARSDPAMNYGLVSAVLLNKIALKNFQEVSDDIGIKLYPIIGVGSAPFRGNLKPETVDRSISETPSVHTYSIQSAFKYDNSPEIVRKAIRKLHNNTTKKPHAIEIEESIKIIEKQKKEYQKEILRLSPIINRIAQYVPKRRKRKLHTGLFGYSRSVGEIQLPRAITFTASLYSIGIPPEIIGLNALDSDDIQFIKKIYVNFENDLKDALVYFNSDSPFLSDGLLSGIKGHITDIQIDIKHKKLTDYITNALKKNTNEDLREQVLKLASLRKFLG